MTILKNIAWGVLGLFVFMFAVIVLIAIFSDSEQDNLGITLSETALYFDVNGFSIDEEGSAVITGTDKLFVVMKKPGYTVLMVAPTSEGDESVSKQELTSIQIVARSGYGIEPDYFLEFVRVIFGDCKRCLEWFQHATEELDGRLQEEVETTLEGKYVSMETDATESILLRMTIRSDE